MKHIINLTPHDINVVRESGDVVTFPPSGQVARISVDQKKVGQICGVDVFTSQRGDVCDLPDQATDIFLIVSMAIRTAFPDRTDLLSPGTLVRNDQGQPIGCRGLVSN